MPRDWPDPREADLPPLSWWNYILPVAATLAGLGSLLWTLWPR